MRREDRGVADTFLEGLCIYRTQLTVLFVISVVFFLLSAISYRIVDPGTETYVITVLNLLGLGVLGLSSGVILYLCRRGEQGRR